MATVVPPDQRPVRRAAPRTSRRRSLTEWLTALLALAMLVPAAACTSTGTAGGDGGREAGVARAAAPEEIVAGELPETLTVERPTTVAVVGDSITVAAAEHLDAELSALGLDVLEIDAQIGRRMTVGERDRLQTGADIVEFLSARSAPELWVVALGTNDIGQYADEGAVAEQVGALLDRLPADVPVVWVDTWIRGRDEQTDVVNRAIRDVVERRDDAVVVEWSAHAPADGVIAADGVHLTDGLGRQRFAEVVAAGVAALIDP